MIKNKKQYLKLLIEEEGLHNVVNLLAEYCDYCADVSDTKDQKRCGDNWRRNAIKIRKISETISDPDEYSRRSLK